MISLACPVQGAGAQDLAVPTLKGFRSPGGALPTPAVPGSLTVPPSGQMGVQASPSSHGTVGCVCFLEQMDRRQGAFELRVDVLPALEARSLGVGAGKAASCGALSASRVPGLVAVWFPPPCSGGGFFVSPALCGPQAWPQGPPACSTEPSGLLTPAQTPPFQIRPHAEVAADVDLGGHIPPRIGGSGLCKGHPHRAGPPQPQTRLQGGRGQGAVTGSLEGVVWGPGLFSRPGSFHCPLHREDPDLGLTQLGPPCSVSPLTASMCPALRDAQREQRKVCPQELNSWVWGRTDHTWSQGCRGLGRLWGNPEVSCVTLHLRRGSRAPSGGRRGEDKGGAMQAEGWAGPRGGGPGPGSQSTGPSKVRGLYLEPALLGSPRPAVRATSSQAVSLPCCPPTPGAGGWLRPPTRPGRNCPRFGGKAGPSSSRVNIHRGFLLTHKVPLTGTRKTIPQYPRLGCAIPPLRRQWL